MIGYVYITENIINGRLYIGKHYGTTHDPNYLGSGKLLQSAIKKYGKQNFTNKVLMYCETEQQLNAQEIHFIKYYSLTNSLYNLAAGGAGGNTTLHHSDDEKKLIAQKRSSANKLIHQSYTPERKAQIADAISKSKIGKGNNRQGYKHSEKAKENISSGLKSSPYYKSERFKDASRRAGLANRGKPAPNKTALTIDGIWYDSIKNAATTLGVSSRTIFNWVNKGTHGIIYDRDKK